jgi:hypothetical protein
LRGRLTPNPQEDSRREKSIAPSAVKAQELRALVPGQPEVPSGEELLSLVVRLATERVVPEAVEDEHAVA